MNDDEKWLMGYQLLVHAYTYLLWRDNNSTTGRMLLNTMQEFHMHVTPEVVDFIWERARIRYTLLWGGGRILIPSHANDMLTNSKGGLA